MLHAAGEKCRTPQDAGFEDWLASTIATFVLKFFRDRCASTERDPVAAGALALPCVGIPDELTEQCHSTEQGPLELPHGRGPYSIAPFSAGAEKHRRVQRVRDTHLLLPEVLPSPAPVTGAQRPPTPSPRGLTSVIIVTSSSLGFI